MVKEILVRVSGPAGDELVIFPNDDKKKAEEFIAEQFGKPNVEVQAWRGIVLDIKPRVTISTALADDEDDTGSDSEESGAAQSDGE